MLFHFPQVFPLISHDLSVFHNGKHPTTAHGRPTFFPAMKNYSWKTLNPKIVWLKWLRKRPAVVTSYLCNHYVSYHWKKIKKGKNGIHVVHVSFRSEILLTKWKIKRSITNISLKTISQKLKLYLPKNDGQVINDLYSAEICMYMDHYCLLVNHRNGISLSCDVPH